MVGRRHGQLRHLQGESVALFATICHQHFAELTRHDLGLHLVLAPAQVRKPIRFRVTIDGAVPGENHGTDINAAGEGVVTTQRLYQLIRQHGAIDDRAFEIQFFDPGVQAYSFTFG